MDGSNSHRRSRRVRAIEVRLYVESRGNSTIPVLYFAIHFCTSVCFSLIRQAMAKLFWELGEEPITSALAASRIYHAMAKNLPRHESNLKDVLMTCER